MKHIYAKRHLIILLLFILSAFRQGVSANALEETLARAAVPISVIKPVIDGVDNDLAWKAASSAIPGINTSDFCKTLITCDEDAVYLLIKTDLKKVAATGNSENKKIVKPFSAVALTVEFGPASGLQRIITIATDGTIKDAAWNGWEWDELWSGGQIIRVSHSSDFVQTTEIAIPRNDFYPSAFRPGANVALRIRYFDASGKKLFEQNLGGGNGIMLEAYTAPLSISWTNSTGRQEPKLRLVNWNTSLRKISVNIYPGYAAQSEPLVKHEITNPQTGVMEILLSPLSPEELDSPAFCLVMNAEGQKPFSCLVFTDRHFSSPMQVLEKALHNASFRNRHLSGLLAKRNGAVASSLLASAVKRLPQFKLPSFSAVGSSPEENIHISGFSESFFNDDGSPDWIRLSRAANERANMRSAYIKAVSLDYLLPLIERYKTKRNPQTALDIVRRYMQWRGYFSVCPILHDGSSAVEWRADIAMKRACVLFRLASGVFLSDEGRGMLAPCLSELLLTLRYVAENLHADNGASRFDPDTCRILAAYANNLSQLFGELQSMFSLAPVLAHLQLVARSAPDKTCLRPATDELALCRTLVEILDMKPAGGNFTDPELIEDEFADIPQRQLLVTDIEKILHSITRTTMTGGRIPHFANSGYKVNPDEITGWVDRFFPDKPGLNRFLPEAAAAFPQDSATPADNTAAQYSGLYVMRSPTGLNCSIYAPGSNGFEDFLNRPASLYGALSLSLPDFNPVVEPLINNNAWNAPLSVASQTAAANSLPVCGRILPHQWLASQQMDYLSIGFGLVPADLKKSRCRRQVFLVKGGMEYVFVADSTGFKTDRFELSSSLALGAEADKSLNIITESTTAKNRFTCENGKSILRLSKELKNGNAQGFVLSPTRSVTADNTESVHGLKHLVENPGGNLYGLAGSGLLHDYILTAPFAGKEGFKSKSPYSALKGKAAFIRFRDKRIIRISLFDAEYFAFNRKSKLKVKLSHPCNVYIEIRDDGSWLALLHRGSVASVNLDIDLTPTGRISDRSASVPLVAGNPVVFRPLRK